MLTHIAQFSTRTGSAEITWRAVEEFDPNHVVLLTAVTYGSRTEVA